MIRVMFVDDEPRVLDGLRRMVMAQRLGWDIQVASSGREALAALEGREVDVVVSDMRMPEMDGAELLERVKDVFPKTVRIILTGQSEPDAIMRALRSAHQLIAKPCDAATLSQTILRTLQLRDTLASGLLQRMIGDLDRLPAAPGVVLELDRVLRSEESGTRQMATIIERDPGMATKVLQVANSAFFGRHRNVTSIEQAITMLGTSMVRQVTLTVGAFDAFRGAGARAGERVDALQRHALRVAALAHRIHQVPAGREAAFAGGLLHDIGKLVIEAHLPEAAAKIAEAVARGTPAHDVERATIEVTHAEIGAYLLTLWGLPYPVIEAVAFHHRGEVLAGPTLAVPATVLVANALVCEREGAPGGGGVGGVDLQRFLEEHGAGDSLDEWRGLVDGVAEEAA